MFSIRNFLIYIHFVQLNTEIRPTPSFVVLIKFGLKSCVAPPLTSRKGRGESCNLDWAFVLVLHFHTQRTKRLKMHLKLLNFCVSRLQNPGGTLPAARQPPPYRPPRQSEAELNAGQ